MYFTSVFFFCIFSKYLFVSFLKEYMENICEHFDTLHNMNFSYETVKYGKKLIRKANASNAKVTISTDNVYIQA